MHLSLTDDHTTAGSTLNTSCTSSSGIWCVFISAEITPITATKAPVRDWLNDIMNELSQCVYFKGAVCNFHLKIAMEMLTSLLSLSFLGGQNIHQSAIA